MGVLDGKVAIVTGGGRGIGARYCRGLALVADINEAGARQVAGAKVGLSHATGGGISGFDHGACSIHIFQR